MYMVPHPTPHAMLMLFFFIMPGVMSGLGNLLVPIQLCVPEMVFPKVNNLGTSYVLTSGARSMVTPHTGDLTPRLTPPHVYGMDMHVSILIDTHTRTDIHSIKY